MVQGLNINNSYENYNKYPLKNSVAVNQNSNNFSAPKFKGELKQDTVSLSTPQTKAKQNKTALTLSCIGLAIVGTLLAGKGVHSYRTNKALKQIDQKFLNLQEKLPDVQKTFKNVFLRNDITEKETLEILNRYKEIEKLGVTETKEKYIEALYKEANKNYGIEPIKLRFKDVTEKEKKTIGGRTSSINHYIYINPNAKKDELIDVIHHELRHAKQNILMYNYAPEKFKQSLAYPYTFNYDKEVQKYVDELIDAGVLDAFKIRDKIAEKFKGRLDHIVQKFMGKPNIDKVPKEQRSLAEKLLDSSLKTDFSRFNFDHEYYKNRFFEIDARYAGENMAKLFGKTKYTKS